MVDLGTISERHRSVNLSRSRATLSGEKPMSGLRCNDRARLAEAQFYSSYSWCLNPLLSLRDLFRRLREELDRYEGLQAGWQREECKINVYLFICAIACTADDYLAWQPWDLSSVSMRLPRLRWAVGPTQWILNLPCLLRSVCGDRSTVRWRRRWNHCVDQVCALLVSELDPGVRQWSDLRREVQALINTRLPERLLRRRMRLPEGFRSQDLTHRDVFSLVRGFLASHPDSQSRLIVIGPRTAGAYFAPLAKVYLSALGWPRVSWITIRPKMGLSRWERRRLRALGCQDARVLLVDDHPNTGQTFRLMLGILRQLGARSEQITILAPRHPVRPDWSLPEEVGRGVRILTLEASEIYKERLLEPGAVTSLLREYFGDCGWEDVRIQENAQVDALNARLQQHYQDGFQARVKRVFAIRLTSTTREPVVAYISAKSVGWGWLGYHAYIAGTRLAGFVPQVIGLRNGLLLMEWVGELSHSQVGIADGNLLPTLSSYIARRVHCLRLAEDPCFASLGYRWAGWEEMTDILRGVYSRYLGRVKVPALRRQLRRYVSPLPTLIDGQMRAEEWVRAKSSICKVDFEHHNFGGAELDLVDPAYDLASAIFEFRLSEPAEQELLCAYTRESGDRTITDRILLYKLLYGTWMMKRAARRVACESSRRKQQEWHLLYLSARRFLISHMSRYCAGRTAKAQQARWSTRLFFLDLDGVFDRELFGFPHTTVSGLAALALLQSRGFSVVPNTGRSVEHVRHYCQVYTLPGGLAEHGSVFVDAVRQRELALIDAEATEQLARCREAVQKIPGVFIDPEYRYSVRAFRYDGQCTVGLHAGEVDDLLARYHCAGLDIIARSQCTDIVQKGTGKGPGVLSVKRYLGCAGEPVAAMGDSELDLGMLEIAEFSYAPANCSKRVRELANKAKCRIMDQPFQRGLLAAARDMIQHSFPAGTECSLLPEGSKDGDDLLQTLLEVAERPRWRQLLAVCNWRSL
ncbi:MAG TPA: HAD hydrolase family protein [Candidatus Binatia bacterium]|jgi:hydroxymethylpyrimidine pyrophosphatase-like HAD family hydrolase|nr:HAD hydrolase family protein [Candidatus Binatia bacterium]